MDDVIISSPSFTQHVKHLKEVFRLLHEAGLTLNKDKCKFGCEELKYLGLIINKEGIKTDETKVQAIVEMKPQRNSKEVSKFLGMSQCERLGIRHVKPVVYRPQANRTERVNRDLVQMIANYVNEQHDTWDQFLREFAYAICTVINETTGKTPAELILGRKLITPFQKLVMVSDGTEFAVGDIEKSFEEARRNTKTKHEKWEYYNRRRRDVQMKVNDWVLVATHPLSSATRKVVAKFKPNFEGPYRVLDVKNNNVVLWKAGKRLTINVDQVRIYRHRKCDETEIGTGSSDNSSLRAESSGFDRVQWRSQMSREMVKRKGQKKKSRTEKTVTPTTSRYNLRPRNGKVVESRPTIERKHNKKDQFDPEKAEEGTIAPTSKNEQDQATRMPDEELIDNGKTRKGEESVQKSLYSWRSW
ncbi:retrovirus-related Pol polyprotein from transposon 17.6 [Trichonephila clavipes]|nr:retrovirus-related Pol polyprotein from transposon 17.6 [Trichonephila clavipes]